MQSCMPLTHILGIGFLLVPPAGSSVGERRWAPVCVVVGSKFWRKWEGGPEEKLNFPLIQMPWGKGSAAFLSDGVRWVKV